MFFMNGNRYPFKRYAYYEIEKKIANSKIVFLVGPRKSGKTVCLKQLEDNCSNAIYYDLKGMNLDNKLDAIEKICEAIKTGEDTLFLIDEFTYAQYPDISLENIANAFSDNNESKSKIVITGSQSFALKNWANTSFCANAEFVDVNFITYSEWLDYKKISDVSRESYYEYITSTKEFYGFTNVKSYLEATLHETIESNNNAANVIIGNDVSGLDAEMLLDVLYAAMFSRHDKIS